MSFDLENLDRIAEILKSGGLGVIPTDTIYAIAVRASDVLAVEKMYAVRKRDEGKPCIVIISDMGYLETLGIVVTDRQKAFLNTVWPGPVSVILPIESGDNDHLLRGGATIALRMPAFPLLRELLRRTGPLLAPSANTQGSPPASDTGEAWKYFGRSADVYADAGVLRGEPSTLIRFDGDCIVVVRQGAMSIHDLSVAAEGSGFLVS